MIRMIIFYVKLAGKNSVSVFGKRLKLVFSGIYLHRSYETNTDLDVLDH